MHRLLARQLRKTGPRPRAPAVRPRGVARLPRARRAVVPPGGRGPVPAGALHGHALAGDAGAPRHHLPQPGRARRARPRGDRGRRGRGRRGDLRPGGARGGRTARVRRRAGAALRGLQRGGGRLVGDDRAPGRGRRRHGPPVAGRRRRRRARLPLRGRRLRHRPDGDGRSVRPRPRPARPARAPGRAHPRQRPPVGHRGRGDRRAGRPLPDGRPLRDRVRRPDRPRDLQRRGPQAARDPGRHRLAHRAGQPPGLPGAADRRHRAGRCATGRRCALLVLDLDGFKAVNDSLGHQAGDAVLVALADRMRAAAREGDLLARVGGEEFAWLLPETDARRRAGGRRAAAHQHRRAAAGPVRGPDRLAGPVRPGHRGGRPRRALPPGGRRALLGQAQRPQHERDVLAGGGRRDVARAAGPARGAGAVAGRDPGAGAGGQRPRHQHPRALRPGGGALRDARRASWAGTASASRCCARRRSCTTSARSGFRTRSCSSAARSRPRSTSA